MTFRAGNLAAGVVIAAVVAVAMIVPSIGNVSTWKILLAAIGVTLLVLGGRSR